MAAATFMLQNAALCICVVSGFWLVLQYNFLFLWLCTELKCYLAEMPVPMPDWSSYWQYIFDTHC